MKFSANEFIIDKKYAQEPDQKVKKFRQQTKTRKKILLTMITSFGVKQNIYYPGRVVAEVRMEELFD